MKNLALSLDVFLSADVLSKLYHTTTVVVDLRELDKGKKEFPTGDGCDYTVTEADLKRIACLREGEKNKERMAMIHDNSIKKS